MTTAVLASGVTAVQTSPAGGNPVPTGSQSANPAFGALAINPQTQTFELTVVSKFGPGPNVSATAKIMVSNDGVNWMDYGLTLSASSAASPNNAMANGTAPWQFYTAYISAISSNSIASVTMAY